MNDPNTPKWFLTRQFHVRCRQLVALGSPLVLVLGLSQLALAQDPIIIQQPTSRSASEGGSVSFVVRATTTNGPLSLQWQRDDSTTTPVTFTNIPNANRGALNLLDLTPGHAGDYRVIVANAAGDSVTSDVAHLEVSVAPFRRVNADELGDAGFLGQGFPYWIDMNQDGWLDALLARDLTAPLAYENQRAGAFVGIRNELTKLNKR